MREQVSLPTIDTGSPRRPPTPPIPWAAPNATCAAWSPQLADPARAETFRIMTFKCEYVGELGRELDRQRSRCSELTGKLAQVYRRARRAGQLRPG